MAVTKTQVYLTNNDTGTSQTIELDGVVTEFPLTGLQPYTNYTAYPRAECSNLFGNLGGYSALGSPVTFTTLPLSQSSYLVGYDSDRQVYSFSNPSNAYTEPTSASGYATIYLTRGTGAVTYFYWNFGLNIPEDATILSVTCRFRALTETTVSARIPVHTGQLYAGTTTPKGTPVTIANTATTYTVTFSGSDWTPAELNNAKLKIYAERGTENVNTSYTMRTYGAEIVVEYY